MESEIRGGEYKSKDFYICVTLKTLGVPLLRIEQSDQSFVLFVFNIDPIQAEDIVAQY